MRKLTLGAVALATTLLASGAAWAVDEQSLNAADATAEAGATVQTERHLGYAESGSHQHPAFATVDRKPVNAAEQADRLFLEQGDRGIGNE